MFSRLLEDVKDAGSRGRLLLMLDEFASLGRLKIFEPALATMAGYGLKAYTVVQDIEQLRAAYGREENIMSNSHVQVAYAANKIETAELLSKLTGVETSRHRTKDPSRGLGDLSPRMTERMQAQGRPLLKPDEVMRMPLLKDD